MIVNAGTGGTGLTKPGAKHDIPGLGHYHETGPHETRPLRFLTVLGMLGCTTTI